MFDEAARYANRQSGRAQDSATCGFDSHSCQLAIKGWCPSRRSVKPLPQTSEAAGKRFDSFTTHFRGTANIRISDLLLRICYLRFQLRPQAEPRPRGLPVQDATLSRWKSGFDSRRG